MIPSRDRLQQKHRLQFRFGHIVRFANLQALAWMFFYILLHHQLSLLQPALEITNTWAAGLHMQPSAMPIPGLSHAIRTKSSFIIVSSTSSTMPKPNLSGPESITKSPIDGSTNPPLLVSRSFAQDHQIQSSRDNCYLCHQKQIMFDSRHLTSLNQE